MARPRKIITDSVAQPARTVIDNSPSWPLESSNREPEPTYPTGSLVYNSPEDTSEQPSVRSSPISETGRRVVFEPVTQALYNLNYACLLIPRFPQHNLIGDLSVRLSEWMPHLCIAFAWRMEYLSVRPEYMQWIVNVPPTTAPGYLMRIIRQHMSEKIFADFPRIKGENPSGDFWAPGYVLMGGTHPHPAQLVKDFIQQTRQRQGIS